MDKAAKHQIELVNLSSVIVQCKNCETALTIPLTKTDDKKKAAKLPQICPSCDMPWGKETGDRLDGLVQEFLTAYTKLKAFPAAEAKVNLAVLLPEPEKV